MSGSNKGHGGGLSAAFDRLSAHSGDWSAQRVVDEGLDLVRDSMWADRCALYAVHGQHVERVAHRPASSATGPSPLSAEWFPWGLAPVSPRRYLLIDDARTLAIAPEGGLTLGELGVHSCLHLPILERTRPIGALHLFWHEPRLAWDDARGRLLRSLGRFLLERVGASPTEGASMA